MEITDGVLVVNKPAGPTSHDAVALVRRLTGIRKVGHTGTLDPIAQGVLPLVLGRATRLARFLTGADKEYDADLRLGASTDTYDAAGTLAASVGLRIRPESLDRVAVEAALRELRGTYLQEPPPFSAKKVFGTPAHRLARRHRPVQLAPVQVTVRALEIISLGGDRLRLRLTCSAGFYVRSLAQALGQRLGTGAYLEGLTRTRSGEFDLARALPLAAFERDPGAALAHAIPLNRLLSGLPAVVLTDEGRVRVLRGNLIGPRHLVPPLPGEITGSVRLFDGAGQLLAVAQAAEEPGVLHPAIVLG